jgi:putative Mg2+ transporter-C (MgtC) family protein
VNHEFIIRFLLALLCGAIIGIEREYRNKSAGFRTMILISLGACFFTFISQVMGAPDNPDRIASNIVSGIGFIGAGVIFKGDNTINGITTAATIWVVAAVGMGIGAGYYLVSISCSVLVTIILSLLSYLQRYIEKLNEAKNYCIVIAYSNDVVKKIETVFNQFRANYKLTKMNKKGSNITLEWNVQTRSEIHANLSQLFMEDKNIIKFSC